MFDRENGETIEWLSGYLENFNWEDQEEKRERLKELLDDLESVDRLLETLKQKFPASLELIKSIDPELSEAFSQAFFHLTQRIIQFMQNEDPNIREFDYALKEDSMDSKSIKHAQHNIEWWEANEKETVKYLRKWITRMRLAVREAYRRQEQENKVALLRDLDNKLKHSLINLKRLKKEEKKEEKKVERGEPIAV